MTNNKIHIICLDVPYPPNYGGAIETFYKIKSLQSIGVKLHVHAFVYGDRQESELLESQVDEVSYYRRNTTIIKLFGHIPYIVNTRESKKLLNNLLADEAPIIFDGLHTTAFLTHPQLKNRVKIVRMHNVEWIYYQHLADIEHYYLKKLYFRHESSKLKDWETTLLETTKISCLSTRDEGYYKKKGISQVNFVPAFHENEHCTSLIGRGNYLLFHGNLNISDNIKSLYHFINNRLEGDISHLKVAGKCSNNRLSSRLKKDFGENLELNPDLDRMSSLVKNAHINLALGNAPTGVKLKLINSLFQGRFCVADEDSVMGSGLDHLVIKSQDFNFDEWRERPFTEEDLHVRKQGLGIYNNIENAKILISNILNTTRM